MKLQDQVCTLEQAKRLKKLGVRQDTLFSWCGSEEPRIMDNGPDGMEIGGWLFVDRTIPYNNQHADHRDDVPSAKPFVAAPTVAELGLMMGTETYTQRLGTATSQYANWDWDGAEKRRGPFATEAEARADFVIKMLEIEMYTAEEVNRWLEA